MPAPNPYAGMAYGSPEFKRAAERERIQRENKNVAPKQAPITATRTHMSAGWEEDAKKKTLEITQKYGKKYGLAYGKKRLSQGY